MKRRFETVLYHLLILFLPVQLGKHFWPDFSYILGVRTDYLSPTIYLTDIFIGGLFVLWCVRILAQIKTKNSKLKTQNSKLQFKNKNALIALFLIGYLLLVTVISGRIPAGAYFLLKILEMGLVGLYTAKFISLKNFYENVSRLLGVGVIAESVTAIAQFFKHGSIGGFLYFLGERTFTSATPGIANASLRGELVLRPYGTLPHPNVLAGYLLIGLIVVLFSYYPPTPQQEKRTNKQAVRSAEASPLFMHTSLFAMKLLALILGSLALLLSMSRVPILLWVGVLFYYFLKHIKNMLYPLVFAIVAVLLLLTPVGTRFTHISMWDESITQRETLANASIAMIENSPLFGVGLSNFIPTLSQIEKPLTASTYLQPVHNIFLLVGAETGLIGLGIFCWFLWNTCLRIKQYEAREKEMLAILVGTILITGLFDHYWLTLQQGQLLLALILGFCWNSDILTTKSS